MSPGDGPEVQLEPLLSQFSVGMGKHTGYKTYKQHEQGQHIQHCHPLLSLPTPIPARPLSWACRSVLKALLTALEAAATRAGRAPYRGALPPEGKRAYEPSDELQALTRFLEPGLGLRLARLTLGSDRSSSKALVPPFPLMSARLPRAAARLVRVSCFTAEP